MIKGSKHSVDTIELYSYMRTGVPKTEEENEKNRQSHLGNTWSEETRALNKKIRASKEWKEKRRLAQEGKPHVSEEGKNRQAEKARLRWADPVFRAMMAAKKEEKRRQRNGIV